MASLSDLRSLICPEVRVKVSSTLDKSTGKKHIIDRSPETCWTSQQGLPQYIQISFPSLVTPKCLAITFQGGFVGTRCVVDAMAPSDRDKQWHTLTRIYPEDVNRRQVFDLIPVDPSQALAEKGIDCLRLLFEESSDFFGRITVYDLEIQGNLVS